VPAAIPAVLLAVALAGCPGPKGDAASKTPGARPPVAGNRVNVLLITIDTLRADHMGVYGYRRATSARMDAFARRGVVFDEPHLLAKQLRQDDTARVADGKQTHPCFSTSTPR
jgi:hypothetical protein